MLALLPRTDAFAILRPTSPFRGAATIRRAWERFTELGERIDSIRAVEPCRQHPGKMWVVHGDDLMSPLLPQPEELPFHSRQYAALPPVHVQNSSLEIAWTRVATEDHTIAGDARGALLHGRARGLLDRLPGRLRARRGVGCVAAGGCGGAAPGGRGAVTLAPPARSAELERIRAADADPVARAAAFADACRINALYMIARAGSGHVGTSFSCMDILSWLHLEVLEEGDRYFSSKGHDAPALYSVLIGTGALPFEGIHGLRRLGGLPGHPDVVETPELWTSTGSLGMGISKARGFARANRLQGRRGRVFVLTGDGELQEGQFWESLGPTANGGFGEITAIVDHNKLQSDTFVSEVSDLGDLERKAEAFGWAVARCDGNDMRALAERARPARRRARAPEAARGGHAQGRRRLVHGAARPARGEHLALRLPLGRAHARGVRARARRARGAPGRAAGRDRASGAASWRATSRRGGRPRRCARSGWWPPTARRSSSEAERDPRLVALDADLVLDTGLVPFRERFPERFVECGIAEQDMVSQAGAMALAGPAAGLPLVRVLPLDAPERADLQQRHGGDEGRLRGLAGGARAGRARPLAPVRAGHLGARRACRA